MFFARWTGNSYTQIVTCCSNPRLSWRIVCFISFRLLLALLWVNWLLVVSLHVNIYLHPLLYPVKFRWCRDQLHRQSMECVLSHKWNVYLLNNCHFFRLKTMIFNHLDTSISFRVLYYSLFCSYRVVEVYSDPGMSTIYTWIGFKNDHGSYLFVLLR